MLASIFRQLGGQGHVAGFMAGDGGNASGANGNYNAQLTVTSVLGMVLALIALPLAFDMMLALLAESCLPVQHGHSVLLSYR